MGLILLKDMCFVFSLCLMLVRSSTFKLTDDLGQHYSGEYYLKYIYKFFLYGCCLLVIYLFIYFLPAMERNNLMRLAHSIPFTPVSLLGK